MLVGTTACLNVCAAEGAVQFPKTNAVLLACSHALASTPAVGAAYMSVLLAIYVQRRSGSLPRQEELEEELRRPPEIRLVQDLELEGVRLWGCIPKADVDVAVFGSGICINVDMARALEGTQDPYVELACKVLLCTTMAHEEMHLLNHRFFPELRLQKNPPDIGSVLGESGWAFEDLCFGSQVMVTWASQAHIGDFESIDRVTLRKPLSTATQHILTSTAMRAFVDSMEAGSLADISELASKSAVSRAPYPLVSTRGQSFPVAQLPWGSGLALGEVALIVGQDRAPYTSTIYPDTIHL